MRYNYKALKRGLPHRISHRDGLPTNATFFSKETQAKDLSITQDHAIMPDKEHPPVTSNPLPPHTLYYIETLQSVGGVYKKRDKLY